MDNRHMSWHGTRIITAITLYASGLTKVETVYKTNHKVRTWLLYLRKHLVYIALKYMFSYGMDPKLFTKYTLRCIG